MAVESIQIFHRDGRQENVSLGAVAASTTGQVQVHRQAPIVYTGSSSVSVTGPAQAEPAPVSRVPEAPPFIVFVDPDVFGDSAPDVVRWLTLAGLGLFAVGRSAGTVWPEVLTPDQAALKNMFRRVQLLRANCKGQMATRSATAELVKPPTDRPPPKKAKPRAKGDR